MSTPNTNSNEVIDTPTGDPFSNIKDDIDDKNKNIMEINSNDPNEEKNCNGGADDSSRNVPPQIQQMTQVK